jgi:drug/metabolite transporter (DMT)-like permease
VSNRSSRPLAILIALAVVFIWSTSWILVKHGLKEIPALTFGGLQNTLAFICLLPIANLVHIRRPIKLPSRNVWIKLAVLGFFQYAATQGALYLALSYLPAVTTNLIGSISPIVISLFGIFFLLERPTMLQWIGIAATTMGAALYFGPAGIHMYQSIGLIFAILTVLANAGALIVGRDINRDGELSPLIVTVISMGIGSIALVSVAIAIGGFPHISPAGWAMICWLAIVNTALGSTLWNYTQRTLSAAESSIVTRTMMVWIAILAVIFLNEKLSPLQIASLIFVGIGTLMVQLKNVKMKKAITKG